DIIGKPYVMVHKEGQGSGEFFITLPKNAIKERSSHITIDLMADHKKIATLKTNFLGPVNN
nr:cytochrome c oxidase accessory protein CcoG [Hydrotalea flava]NIM37832.1 cytochrome c oxidase accessory protein CcoG [Hydrotalea flava]NIN03001.1 cytochrome c oxidase accessory protein CcoG [Hydrotalea flava]NIN14686.1 cytochrome c oxidase accessory protein CcoG [Hydrotalea flava]NIO93758.1 cytochrome c oxidase accessory protein CcoG [Hydrotalea flava]